MALSRRDMLRNTAFGAGVVAVGNVGALLTSKTALAAPADGKGWTAGGAYGPLVPDPAGILDLPEDFSYTIVSTEGTVLATGGALPGSFDGTGSFIGPNGSYALVRNHEISAGSAPGGTTLGTDPAFVYDPLGRGGTSTVVFDAEGTKIDEYISLAGTATNCAGGVTPWGTWLTCEETEAITANKRHGYVFEVDPWNVENNRNPQPLMAFGRAAHEAVVIDPATLTAYITEDAGNLSNLSALGLVYRVQFDDPKPQYGGLRGTGQLTAMTCSRDGAHVENLHAFSEIGTTLAVNWVAVPDPDATTTPKRRQFTNDQVTRSRKFEGMWWADGKAYIVCSFAEGFHAGQVWSLDPAAGTLTLEVRFEPLLNDNTPNEPDNITISPWGGMILCEDGSGAQHLVAVAPDGSTSLFARNLSNENEFAGACFSPDRHTLYVNIQSGPGTTYAITGPWARVRRAG